MLLEPNRHIYIESDKPLSTDELKDRDAQFKKMSEKSELKLLPEELECLNEIDFDLLKEIFTDIAIRCGIDPDTLNLLPKSNFVKSKGKNALLFFSAAENLIHLTQESETPKIRELIKLTYGSFKLWFLNAIIHEQIHAVSKITLSQFNSHADQFQHEMVGYEISKGNGFAGIFLKSFNEGVTQKLANQVTLQYLKLKSSEKQEPKVEDILNDPEKSEVYPDEIELVDLIIKKIAENTGQAEKIIWEALIRGMLEGTNFENEELKNLFAEVFDEDFINNLYRTNPFYVNIQVNARISGSERKSIHTRQMIEKIKNN